MARNFTLDLPKLREALERSVDETENGVKRGLIAVKNDWVADAVDIAPVKTHNLQKQISGQVDDVSVMITANARRKNGDFNYGYYVHEVAGNKFLDNSIDEAQAQATLEREIEKALRKAGF